MTLMKYRLLLLLIFPFCPLMAQESASKVEDRSLLYVGTGIYNIVRNKKAALVQLEYRPYLPIYRNSFLLIRPLVGAMATMRGSTYFYLGVAFDVFLGDHLVFTPSFAPGLYLKGGGQELGLPLEFRSSAELAYRREKGDRFGAMFYHMSNASLGSKNPGTECLVFFYAIPLN